MIAGRIIKNFFINRRTGEKYPILLNKEWNNNYSNGEQYYISVNNRLHYGNIGKNNKITAKQFKNSKTLNQLLKRSDIKKLLKL